MGKEIAIYVSAAPEMDVECELLGQFLATLMQSVRWTIKRTPAAGEYGNPDLEALAHSQFYLILLGRDIMAPMGVEWRAAQEHAIYTMAYRATYVPSTPAASVFAHQSGIAWREYKSPQEFIQDFERRLIRQLIDGTPGYGLSLEDIEELATRLKELEKTDQEPSEEVVHRGAGRGGVILPS